MNLHEVEHIGKDVTIKSKKSSVSRKAIHSQNIGYYPPEAVN